jgi:hypothetical protein
MMQPADHRYGDGVVQAFPSKAPDHALAVEILPRRLGRGQDLLDSYRTHATNEGRAIDLASVPDEILRRRVVREGVHQLLTCPPGGRTLSDVEVYYASALVPEDEEDVQDAKRGRGNDKEVADAVTDSLLDRSRT